MPGVRPVGIPERDCPLHFKLNTGSGTVTDAKMPNWLLKIMRQSTLAHGRLRFKDLRRARIHATNLGFITRQMQQLGRPPERLKPTPGVGE